MSKADQLGAGRFGGSARPVSARRAAIGAATGVPTEGVAPPTRLPVQRISPNPDNPRTSLGDLTELAASLKEHGQKQAVTVMNRDAYVKANPTRANDLEPDTTHVVVDGSSRLAAAREAGLTHLNVMVDDEQGSDGDAILESALVANIHRNDLDPLDEARALQRLLGIHGSQVKLAKRLSKSQGWVSQRLALLNLTPALQAVVGEEPVELLRSVAKAPHERQQALLEELKAERARKDSSRPADRGTLPPTGPTGGVAPAGPAPAETAENTAAPEDTGSRQDERNGSPDGSRDVLDGPGEGSAGDDSARVPAPATVPPTRTSRRTTGSSARDAVSGTGTTADTALGARAQEGAVEWGESVPDPRAAESKPGAGDLGGGVPQLPYGDGALMASHLIRTMNDTEFDTMLHLLNKHRSERVASGNTAR